MEYAVLGIQLNAQIKGGFGIFRKGRAGGWGGFMALMLVLFLTIGIH
jgi:hypothetical protein